MPRYRARTLATQSDTWKVSSVEECTEKLESMAITMSDVVMRPMESGGASTLYSAQDKTGLAD